LSSRAPPEPDLPSEAASRERRGVALVIALLNLAFLAIDLAGHGVGNAAVWAGRLGVSAALLALWRQGGRLLDAARLRAFLAAVVTACAACFALICAGTGWLHGPYLAFYPLLPIVAAIMVPDEPLALLAGSAVTVAVTGIATAHLPAGTWAFWLIASASSAFYAVTGAELYRRMRRRARASAAAREAALTDLARSGQQRAQADRLASIGRLASGVAHEINNPLAFVSTNLAYVEEELRERHPGEAGLLEALAESRGGVERIKRIVQDLRGFARGASSPGPTDVAAAVEEAVRLASWRLGRVARVERALAPGLPAARADRAELVQVLVNLLVNAADAVEEARRGSGTVVISAAEAGGGVQVTVEDDGVGLPPGGTGQLFEPFFTTKGAGGTGLGLAISREFAERWGGTLTAGPRAGGGARFTLQIPAPAPGQAAPAAAPDARSITS
jgi:signal transduction histidine kinase